MSFSAASAISEIENPLDWSPKKDQLMAEACREMAVFHYENCSDVRLLYDKYNFDPNSIRKIEDIDRIPPIGVSAMKYYLLTSMPESKAVLKLTSSGTRGQKTHIWFDQGSLDRVQRMLDVYFEQEKMSSTQLTNYLIFNYDPDQAGDLGIAYTEKNQLRFAPVAEEFYAVKKDESGQWRFLKEKAFSVLESYSKDSKPIRILGMPAFLYEFVEYCRSVGKRFSAPKGSLMITGGGWKAAEDKKVSRSEFRKACSEIFGIPEDWIRDAYGMAEHSAPYFECRNHKFHIAAFNRLIARDPVTLERVPDDHMGLLELVTPFNAIMPTLAILSTDWVVIHSKPCSCGWKSPTFELLGRAGISKHKGCAIHADDIVKRG
jgi:phenylacetate-coenzyme A ligase PaaK-like adenylate-forming protein